MKKLLLVVLLGISTSMLFAQNNKTLTMVMGYRWTFDTRTNALVSEGQTQDGIEFDFAQKSAAYYTPGEKVYETKFKINKHSGPVVNDDKSKTYEYDLYMIATDKVINCILTVSKDLRQIKFTMIDGDIATVYNVTNLLTDEDN